MDMDARCCRDTLDACEEGRATPASERLNCGVTITAAMAAVSRATLRCYRECVCHHIEHPGQMSEFMISLDVNFFKGTALTLSS